jgi:hypothetical protein
MKDEARPSQKQEESLSLSQATTMLLEECRMVLPGMQALFGFQLMVVFNNRFAELLSHAEQRLHLVATGLIALAVALIMTPAAYHRQLHPHHATERFIRISTRLLLWSMPPLAVSLCIEFYLICRVIIGSFPGCLIASGMFAIFFFLWFVLPRVHFMDRIFGMRG